MDINANRRAGNTAAAGQSGAGADDFTHSNTTAPRPQVVTTKPVAGGVQILLNGGKVATVRGDTLYRTIHRSRHFYKGCICFLVAVLEAAELHGARKCVCHDADPDGKTYTAHLNDLLIHSKPLENSYGVQRALPLSHWATSAEQAAAQLSLWGAA